MYCAIGFHNDSTCLVLVSKCLKIVGYSLNFKKDEKSEVDCCVVSALWGDNWTEIAGVESFSGCRSC